MPSAPQPFLEQASSSASESLRRRVDRRKKSRSCTMSFFRLSEAGSCPPWGLKALRLLFELPGNYLGTKELMFLKWEWLVFIKDSCAGSRGPSRRWRGLSRALWRQEVPGWLGLAGFAGTLAGSEGSIPHECLLHGGCWIPLTAN